MILCYETSDYAPKYDPETYLRIEGVRSTYELARLLQADVELNKTDICGTEITEYEMD